MTAQPSPPIVIVAGPTGVGKSLLAIELAKKFNGEVLNADSMQLYSGLDIVTNKVTSEELSQAPHHLIGCLSPLTTDSTVGAYRQLAQPLLDRLLKENRLPIICGGTCYYIEALLWNILLEDGGNFTNDDDDIESELRDDPAEKSDPQELHNRLRAVDPEAAIRLHPNDRRKVARALQVNLRRGDGAYSAMLREQHRLGDHFSGPLRYPPDRLAILWLACRRDHLERRLDCRVDKMIQSGLLAELEAFHSEFNASRVGTGASKDYTRGIFQSIGFKEFHSYLLMSPEQRDSAEGQLALKSGIELMKQRTKRYAVQQEKWLRNRFLRHSDDNYAPVYLLNADSLVESDWTTGVRQPAFEIVEALLKSDENILLKHSTRLATEPRGLVGSSSSLDDSESDSVRIGRSLELRCDHCGVTFAQRDQYKEHMSSRRHAKRMAGLRRLAARIAAGHSDPNAVVVIDRNAEAADGSEESAVDNNDSGRSSSRAVTG
ncbi:hypothetical protein BOX15_Mlig009295g1 [Macrostomum lignano]|uniref:C2H2-type domain-containing protein n=2 Tax=Macrostomum lignano TaxID=282301 RepID=A0A1I8J5S3_9PLAT|nr:hypothetical protein BOX15_Mlig009295g1 [Macrostomum lignano]